MSTNGAPSVATPQAFKEPPRLENRSPRPAVVEVDVVAGESNASLVPGKTTALYTYNGSYPGPTLEATEGDQIVVHFTNRLAEATNLHWHGLHIPSDQDGLPMDLVPPGGKRDYAFTLPKGSAGTYWYHPHPHGQTGRQIAKGLAGAIRVKPAVDPIPAGVEDTLVVLSDNRVDASGAIAPATVGDKMNGREGDLRFVNGVTLPTLPVRPGELRRLRLLNASTARYHRLALPGHILNLIATDGGFVAAPTPVDEVLLAPGERAEVLVRASGAPGSVAELVDLPYTRNMMTAMGGMGGGLTGSSGGGVAGEPAIGAVGHGGHFRLAQVAVASTATPLLKLAYGAASDAARIEVPAALRDVPALPPASAQRTITFTEDHMAIDFRVNEKTYDANRVDVRSALNSTEIWSVRNKGDMDHPFHLHGFSFQVLDRNGRPEPIRAWKDTVNVKKGETVRFAVEFKDFPGPRVFHCHIIEHEDLGMMGTLQVE